MNGTRRKRTLYRAPAICKMCGEEFIACNPKTICCSIQCSWSLRPRGGNQDLFAAWTPDESWLAGLIWADGHLAETSTGDGRVIVSTSDRELIEYASAMMGKPISENPSNRGYKMMYRVSISGLPATRLVQHGLTSRKTIDGSFPESIPHQNAFVRGYFDGDGSVGLYNKPHFAPLRLKSNFVGTRSLMVGIQDVLVEHAGVRRNKVSTHYSSAAVCQLYFNHFDSLKIADFMYADDGPHLARKKSIFAEGRMILPM